MRYLWKALAWLVLFGLVLVWRFPYQAILDGQVANIEKLTGTKLSWSDCQAGLTGADIRELSVGMPSGMKFSADRVIITPSFSGFKAQIDQTTTNGKATVELQTGRLLFHSQDLQVDTGSSDFKMVTMSGDLTYKLSDNSGKGELHLVIPELSGVLPVTLKNLEVGTKINLSQTTAEPSSPNATPQIVSVVDNKLTLFGEGLSGEGQLTARSHANASSALSGELKVTTQSFGTHNIEIGGTWAKPEWNLVGAK